MNDLFNALISSWALICEELKSDWLLIIFLSSKVVFHLEREFLQTSKAEVKFFVGEKWGNFR